MEEGRHLALILVERVLEGIEQRAIGERDVEVCKGGYYTKVVK